MICDSLSFSILLLYKYYKNKKECDVLKRFGKIYHLEYSKQNVVLFQWSDIFVECGLLISKWVTSPFVQVKNLLINNRRMFNVGIDDLAEKPYIPHKSLLQWICCKCLAWWHRHSYFWPQRSWRLLEAKNTPRRPKKAWKSWFIKKSI